MTKKIGTKVQHILRKKRTFNMKEKAFFILFKDRPSVEADENSFFGK